MEIKINRLKIGRTIANIIKNISISITFSTKHVCKMAIKYDIFNKAITSMFIKLNTLMTICATYNAV